MTSDKHEMARRINERLEDGFLLQE